jgi:ribosome biogenesis GTPase / thiamine phosphate phosphatase
VRTDAGETIDAALRGRLKKSNAGRRRDGSLRRDTVRSAAETLKLAVGDDVMLEHSAGGSDWAIAEILPRRSALARRAPGGGQGERIVVANVDQVVVMFAAAKPEPHLRMLDRFLVIAEGNDLAARIIVNKIDLVEAGAARDRFRIYENAGYPVHYVSVKAHLGLADLQPSFAACRTVITGPSGVGKSSLLNAIFPGAGLRVGAISESVNKGRHTTVGAIMLPLPGDAPGYVIDTPGLREVGLWSLPPEHLDRCFPEIRALSAECRYDDCRHVAEPECAVIAGVNAGAVSAERYDSYRRLLDELAS